MSKVCVQAMLVSLVLCSAILTGCGTHSQANNANVTPEQRAAKTSAIIGQSNERRGVMSSEDYSRWEHMGDKDGMVAHISDDDLDWAISVMRKPSTNPTIVHMRVMGLFLTVQAFTDVQRQKIKTAVTPLLSSADTEDVKWAKAVLKRIS